MFDRIRARLDTLPPAERRVAALVLDEPRAFAAQPVATLAERARVSKPTVVRFCRSVGCTGLADFRLKLAAALAEGVPYVHRAVGAHDSAGELGVKVVDSAIAALLGLRNALAPQALERAIAALATAGRDARRIEFWGVGNSGIVAQDAEHKFFRLGVRARAVADGHVLVMSAALLARGDCALVISNSGRSRDLLDAATIAAGKGATLVAITASGSPLARAAQAAPHVLLAADHPEDAERDVPMASRLVHLVLIDVLATGVALRLGSARLQPALAEMKRHLRERRYVPDAKAARRR